MIAKMHYYKVDGGIQVAEDYTYYDFPTFGGGSGCDSRFIHYNPRSGQCTLKEGYWFDGLSIPKALFFLPTGPITYVAAGYHDSFWQLIRMTCLNYDRHGRYGNNKLKEYLLDQKLAKWKVNMIHSGVKSFSEPYSRSSKVRKILVTP